MPGAAQAELPPWAYGEQQRQAKVVMKLKVQGVVPVGGELKARCWVLKVLRQPPSGQLRTGQRVELRYTLPNWRQPGLVGPSPLRALNPGEEITAWLNPIAGERGHFAPAAGGRSFGPAMEQVWEPGAQK
jgi:hypothetical protein